MDLLRVKEGSVDRIAGRRTLFVAVRLEGRQQRQVDVVATRDHSVLSYCVDVEIMVGLGGDKGRGVRATRK